MDEERGSRVAAVEGEEREGKFDGGERPRSRSFKERRERQ